MFNLWPCANTPRALSMLLIQGHIIELLATKVRITTTSAQYTQRHEAVEVLNSSTSRSNQNPLHRVTPCGPFQSDHSAIHPCTTISLTQHHARHHLRPCPRFLPSDTNKSLPRLFQTHTHPPPPPPPSPHTPSNFPTFSDKSVQKHHP